MKTRLQWKDPDYDDATDYRKLTREEKELLQDLFSELGLGEYLLVEVDTEAKTATIIKGTGL